MSEQINPSPGHVVFPAALATAMMECFYGTGPRYAERFGGPPTPHEVPIPKPGEPVPEAPGVPGGEMSPTMGGFRLGNSLREFVPRGYAAKKAGLPSEDEGDPPESPA